MVGEDTHILHHQFRLTKNLGVDALENKVFDTGIIQSHEEGMINVAMSKLLDVSDCSLSGILWFKLVGYINEIIQGCEYLGVLGVGTLNIQEFRI